MKIKIKELKQRLVDTVAKAKELLDKAHSEERDLTEDERKQDDELYAEYQELKASFEREERHQEMERALIDKAPDDTGASLVETPKLFKSIGEQARAVQAAQVGHFRSVDERLLKIQAATGMSEAIPADGGFLVQTDFAAEILRKVHQTGVLVGRTRSIPISATSNGIKMSTVDETSRVDGSRWGGIQAFWTGEGVAATKSKPKTGRLELEVKKISALVYLTEEQLQDTPFLETLIMEGVSEEMGFKLDDAIIRGDGVAKPLGILNANALVSVAKESGQTAATIVYNNVIKMWARLWVRSRAGAVWFVNQDTEPQLDQLAQEVGTVGAIAARFVVDGPDGIRRMKGAPVVAIEHAETLGTKGDILLLDLGQYLMLQKGGMQSASSIHIKFEEGETAFRFTLRTDGQPWWGASMTPYKGSNKVSPFISLDTRA